MYNNKNNKNNKNNPNRVPLNGQFQGSAAKPVDVNLGELRTDSQGRLVFLAGSGHARSVKMEGGPSQKQSSQKEPSQEKPAQKQPNIISEFDSVDWYDNTCDGWVSVSVSYYDPKGVLLKLCVILPPSSECDFLASNGGSDHHRTRLQLFVDHPNLPGASNRRRHSTTS